jgi:uncharacterized protein (TIGR02594 family)
MPDQQEELKLVVTLVDNASAGLDKISEKVKDLGGTEIKNALEQHKRQGNELQKMIKDLQGGFEDAFKSIGAFRIALIGAAGSLGFLGMEIIRQNAELRKWGEELRGISQAAKGMGISAAELKNMISQFGEVGVSAESVTANVNRMSGAIANLLREGSTVRQQLMEAAGNDPQRIRNMQTFIDQLTHAHSIQEQYNILAKAWYNIVDEGIRAGKTAQQATDDANKALGVFWNKTIAARKQVEVMDENERRRQQERIRAGEELANLWGKIDSEISEIIETLKTPMFDVAIAGAKVLLGVVQSIGEIMRKIQDDKLLSPPEAGKSIQEKFAPFRNAPFFPGSAGEEQKRSTDENTDQLKRLNESFEFFKQPSAYSGGGFNRSMVQNANFTTGGSQGYSGGGGYGPFGGGGGFGGVPGGGGSYGSGSGGYGGGGDSPYGGSTGGATGGPESGAMGDPSVPSDILSRAKSVALSGGPDAVSQFMASQGYPKAGAWCGEFAASVVKSVGGTPPSGAAVASNWRNWGNPVEGAPQPGDIAVRRGAATGATGSHVTIVSGVDPQTGTFTGLGGNQAGGRLTSSQFPLRGYTFRRSGDPPNGQVAGAGTGAGAGQTPAGVSDAISSTAGTAGMDEAHWRAIASIESGLDPGSNYNRRTQYKGLFQINQDELGGRGNIYNPQTNAEAAASVAASNNAWFKQRFGRDPTPTETYMMHQQGRGFYSRGTMTNIAGNPYPGMRGPQTHESFEAGWGREIERRADAARRGLAQSNETKVNGTGKITVDVNAPKGTKVGAEGGGLFKDTEINRQTQMEPARKSNNTSQSGDEILSI